MVASFIVCRLIRLIEIAWLFLLSMVTKEQSTVRIIYLFGFI